MSESLLYANKFWPTPKTPARVRIEMTMTADESEINEWYARAEVHLPDGSSRGIGRSIKAESKESANLQAMYELVTLLGEMLADATEKMEAR